MRLLDLQLRILRGLCFSIADVNHTLPAPQEVLVDFKGRIYETLRLPHNFRFEGFLLHTAESTLLNICCCLRSAWVAVFDAALAHDGIVRVFDPQRRCSFLSDLRKSALLTFLLFLFCFEISPPGIKLTHICKA